MPSAPAFSAAWAISTASRCPKPTPAMTPLACRIGTNTAQQVCQWRSYQPTWAV